MVRVSGTNFAPVGDEELKCVLNPSGRSVLQGFWSDEWHLLPAIFIDLETVLCNISADLYQTVRHAPPPLPSCPPYLYQTVRRPTPLAPSPLVPSPPRPLAPSPLAARPTPLTPPIPQVSTPAPTLTPTLTPSRSVTRRSA